MAVGDGVSGDGIYSGVYTVPDLGYVVTGARIFGHVLESNVPATNDGFQSPQTISLDILRPAISTYSFSTNRADIRRISFILGMRGNFHS